MAVFSTTTLGVWADLMATYTYKLSLHSSDPLLTASPSTTEISGGSYARQNVTIARNGATYTLWNTAAVTFTGLPTTTITHIGVWYNSGTNSGSLAFALPLTNSVTTSATNTSWTISANQLVIYL